jgi:hypothetical protein
MGSTVRHARCRVLPLASALAMPVAAPPPPAATVTTVAMLREAVPVLLAVRLAVALTGPALAPGGLGRGGRAGVWVDVGRRLPGVRTMAGIGLRAMRLFGAAVRVMRGPPVTVMTSVRQG